VCRSLSPPASGDSARLAWPGSGRIARPGWPRAGRCASVCQQIALLGAESQGRAWEWTRRQPRNARLLRLSVPASTQHRAPVTCMTRRYVTALPGAREGQFPDVAASRPRVGRRLGQPHEPREEEQQRSASGRCQRNNRTTVPIPPGRRIIDGRPLLDSISPLRRRALKLRSTSPLSSSMASQVACRHRDFEAHVRDARHPDTTAISSRS
jgi:hypothetical protein